MLRRVRIRGYKSLRDAEVRFDKPLTVIFGANAAGKSNLFDALALLSRMVTVRMLPQAFTGHRGSALEAFSFGSGGLTGLRKKRYATFSIEVEFDVSEATVAFVNQISSVKLNLPATPTGQNGGVVAHPDAASGAPRETLSMRYSLTVRIEAEQGALDITDEQLDVLHDGSAKPRTVAKRTVDHTISYEGVSFTLSPSAVSSSTLFVLPLVQPDSPYVLAASTEMSRWHFYALDPNALRQPVPVQAVATLAPNGGDLAAFFNTMKSQRPKQFESLGRALRLLVPEIESFDLDDSSPFERKLVVREAGVSYPSSLISEGTLRVLGLLAVTNPLEPATLAGIEEPENGVHPRRLRLIADLLRTAAEERETQILVNTHSPLLPEYLSGEELIVCRRGDNGTVFERVDNAGLQPPLEMDENATSPNGDAVTPIGDRLVRGDYGG